MATTTQLGADQSSDVLIQVLVPRLLGEELLKNIVAKKALERKLKKVDKKAKAAKLWLAPGHNTAPVKLQEQEDSGKLEYVSDVAFKASQEESNRLREINKNLSEKIHRVQEEAEKARHLAEGTRNTLNEKENESIQLHNRIDTLEREKRALVEANSDERERRAALTLVKDDLERVHSKLMTEFTGTLELLDTAVEYNRLQEERLHEFEDFDPWTIVDALPRVENTNALQVGHVLKADNEALTREQIKIGCRIPAGRKIVFAGSGEVLWAKSPLTDGHAIACHVPLTCRLTKDLEEFSWKPSHIYAQLTGEFELFKNTGGRDAELWVYCGTYKCTRSGKLSASGYDKLSEAAQTWLLTATMNRLNKQLIPPAIRDLTESLYKFGIIKAACAVIRHLGFNAEVDKALDDLTKPMAVIARGRGAKRGRAIDPKRFYFPYKRVRTHQGARYEA